ncbi:MAG: DUF6600 domain-containing protein [Terriglobia bacterium]
MMRHRFNPLIVFAGLVLLPAALLADEGLSHARVVRLSFLSGTAAVQKPGSTVWAKASVNTPLEEGFKVSTSEDSFVEVEFENGSTARLGELSQIEFNQLALDADGNKLNRLTFTQGYGTFHFMPEHDDVYSVKIADATIEPRGKATFRADLRDNGLRVEVFNGSVEFAAAAGKTKLGKNKVLDYALGTQEAFNIHEGIEKDSWDKWTEARDTQAQLSLKDQAVRAHRGIYGWGDLGAYGDWAYFPGFGYGWAPYAPMGWSPYSLGMWDWYGGFGWTWISYEPWGWLPYHYGMWNYDPSFGWFWMPGNFNYWSPALVTWYTGPGWVGWSPRGTQPRPRFNTVTAISTTSFQSGQVVNAQTTMSVDPREGTVVRRLPIQPTAQTMLAGRRLDSDVVVPGRTSFAGRAATSGRAWSRFTPAPATVLMGGNAASERAFVNWNHQGRRPQPLRAQQGETLGGRYRVTGAGNAGFHGSGDLEAGRGRIAPRGADRPAPTVLSRGHEAGGARIHGGNMGGASAGAPRSGGVFSSGGGSVNPGRGASPPSSSRGSSSTRH